MPQALARVGGALYLITIVVGIFNEAFVKGRIDRRVGVCNGFRVAVQRGSRPAPNNSGRV